MKSFIFISLIAVFLFGCDKVKEIGRFVATEQKLTDVYPDIKPGTESFKSIAMTIGNLKIKDANTVMFKLQNDCNLIATAMQFGNHSVQFTPVSMNCPTVDHAHLSSNQISIAFIDTRFFDPTRTQVVFQIYDLSLTQLHTR